MLISKLALGHLTPRNVTIYTRYNVASKLIALGNRKSRKKKNFAEFWKPDNVSLTKSNVDELKLKLSRDIMSRDYLTSDVLIIVCQLRCKFAL